MEQQKRVVILVVVAIVLAIIAIAMSFSGSKEVPTSMASGNVVKQPVDGGRISITILGEGDVEDKLAGGNTP